MTVEAEPGSPVTQVNHVTRAVTHRDGYRSLMQLVLWQAGAIVVLVVALIVSMVWIRPERVYYASYSDGRLVILTPQQVPEAVP